MADLDSEYLNTRKATDDWQAATLAQLSTGTEGAGTLTDPATELTVDATTTPGGEASGDKPMTELKLAGPPGPNTPGEVVTDQPISYIEGKTPEGRPILKNPDGSISTERSITIVDDRINDGKPTNIPSMFGGNQLSEEAAIQRIVEAGGKDPETGNALPGFNTVQEAVDAAIKRSEELGKQNQQSAAPQGKFTVTDPRINEGKPTPFDSLKDAQAAAKTPEPLAKIEENVGVSPLADVLKTSEQKDAAKNFVDLLNIPVEHLAGFLTKGDVTQTATPEELGNQILAPVASKLGEMLDEKQMGMLASAVGILGMAVIDPLNPALAAGQAAKAAKQLSKKPLKDAVEILKSERGSFQPVPGGKGDNPYGSSYSTKKQAGASKKPLPTKTETPVTWDQAVKIDEYQRNFEQSLTTFGERLHAQRGGVQSDVKVFADSISPEAVQMEEFLNLQPGTILKSSDIVAAKRLFTELAEPVRLLAKWLKDNPNDQQAFLAMLERISAVDQGLTKIAGVFAEPGRLQRILALDKPASPMMKADTAERVRINQPYIKQWLDFFQQQQERAAMGAPALTQEKMVKILSEIKSPEEIMAVAKLINKPGWWDMFTEVWINGLLSGPVTHTTNILSNTATLLWNIPERAIASGLSRGAIRPGEAQAMLGGVVESMGDAWALAWKAFQEEASQFGVGKIETPRRAITADALELTGTAGRAVDFLGTAIRLPGRFLLAGDDFFKSIAFRAELRALAKREAFKAINEGGLTGKAAVQKANEIESKILANPPDSIKDAAMEFAAYTTFTRELGETGQKVQALAGTPIGRLILPFVRTPTNIFKFAGERTPLALASRAVRDEIAAGGERRALALAKMSMGAMTMGYIATLAANGYVTGNGPKDPALRELKKATGWQPNSFKIGDTYVSYSRLEPIGSLFGMAADATDLMGQLDELDGEELASALTVAFARNASSKTFVKGMAETLHALTSQDVNVVNNYLEKELPTLIPFSSLLKQSRNVLDPVMRDVDTILDAFKNKVPGFSTDLPPHRNLWGDPVVMEGGLGPDFLSPLYTSSVKPDPVSEEIARLQLPIRKPAKSIDGVQLSPQEYDAYVLLAGGKPIIHGMTLKEKLADLMASPLYERSSDGPDGGKATLVRQIVMDYRDRAKMILQRPDLSQEYLGQDFPELRESLDAARQTQRQKFNSPMTAPGGLTR